MAKEQGPRYGHTLPPARHIPVDAVRLGPQAGPQTQFLSSKADIVVYGGAAGGGKSYAMLLEPLRHVRNPAFGAVIFRRTNPQVTQEGGLWDEAGRLYRQLGASSNQTYLQFTFPKGGTVRFAAMQYESNMFDWQGSQIALIGFDELTHFTERQFWYMMSRNRSVSGVKPYIRATCNPDADSWVARLIAWWINPDTGYAIPERSGVVRYFYRNGEKLDWFDSKAEAMASHPALAAVAEPKSFTFIAATIHDNQVLIKADPTYLASLLALTLIDRERLLGGNWKIRPEAGKFFNRAWFIPVESAPLGGSTVRFWDFASTARTLSRSDPDYTAGVKIRKVGAIYYIEDVITAQANPAEVEQLLYNVSRQDKAQAPYNQTDYAVRYELEGGSAALRDARNISILLDGFDVQAMRPQGDKLLRAKPFAAQALAGNVRIVNGPWNEEFLTHMHHIPEGPHDDIMDATAGAYLALAERDNVISN